MDRPPRRPAARRSSLAVDDGRVDQRAQLAPDRVQAGRDQLGHEHHAQVFDRVDPEGGAGHAAPPVFTQAAGQAGLLAVTDQRLQLPHGLVARGGWPVLLIHGCGLISDAGKGACGVGLWWDRSDQLSRTPVMAMPATKSKKASISDFYILFDEII